MKQLFYFTALIGFLINCSCNKGENNPVFGEYNTLYTQIIYPGADTGTLRDQHVSVSYFAEGQIKVNDYYMYQGGNGNYFSGGNTSTNVNWSLQYFPERDSIEFRWNQYNILGTSTSRYWRGTKVH